MVKIKIILHNLRHFLKRWRKKYLYLTPKEHRVDVLIAHQINREELDKERLAYKCEANRLMNLRRLHWFASRKVIKVEVEFDQSLFVDNPYCMAANADCIMVKLENAWKERIKK